MPRQPAAPRKPAVTKIFVLDTNVLMHDPNCLFRFEEHDIFLPIMTLEELDNNKKGMSEIARNARQASRTLDEMLAHDGVDIDEGIDLYGPSAKLASGRLYLQTEAISAEDSATMKLVQSASITKGLDSALPYHSTEKPVNWLAWRPALKLKIAMIAIGR